VEYLLSAVESVADHGDAFVPLYRLSWRDGAWRPLSAAPSHSEVFRLEGAAQWPADARPPAVEMALEDAALERERTRFLEDASSRGAALRARWRMSPPVWNRTTGNREIDALTWFRYVETEGLST
jgi:hypothetical protein